MTRPSDLWWIEAFLPEEFSDVLKYVLAVPSDKLRIVCQLLKKYEASEDWKPHGTNVPPEMQIEIAALLFPAGIDLRRVAVPHAQEALKWWEEQRPIGESN